MRRFEGKTALVIGGANGIGAAAARRLAVEGARAVIADIDRKAGETLVRELRHRGMTAEFVATDVRDDAAVEAAVAQAANPAGLDVAVHSAYMNTRVGILDPSRDEWDEISQSFDNPLADKDPAKSA